MFNLGIEMFKLKNYTLSKYIRLQWYIKKRYTDTKNIVSEKASYLNYDEIFKIINKIDEIDLKNISHITISGQMHSSMLLDNSKIIDGPYSWQSEKNQTCLNSSNKNVLDLKEDIQYSTFRFKVPMLLY